jgi:hypothetical protein
MTRLAAGLVTVSLLVLAIARSAACAPQGPVAEAQGAHVPHAAGALRFAALGHIRDFVPRHPDVLAALARAINAERPDHVFLLGDYTADGLDEHWRVMEGFLAALEAPVISAPGNHEITQPPRERPLRSYLARFGYTYYALITPQASCLFVNSSDRIEVLGGWLRQKLAELDPERPTVLFCHHQIWEPGAVWKDRQERFWLAEYRPEDRYWLKPYAPDEILPLLAGRVGDVVAGDVARTYEPLTVDGMRMHPIGIGSPGQRAPVVFFVGEIGGEAGDELVLVRRDVELAPDHPWYVGG